MARLPKDTTRYELLVAKMLAEGKVEETISKELNISRRQIRNIKNKINNQTETVTTTHTVKQTIKVRPVSESQYTDLREVLTQALIKLQENNPTRDRAIKKIEEHLNALEKALADANKAKNEYIKGEITEEVYKAEIDMFYCQLKASDMFVKGRKIMADLVADKTTVTTIATVAGTMQKMQMLPDTDIAKKINDESLKDNSIIAKLMELSNESVI